MGLRVGVELGVQRGHFAAHTLKTWPSATRYYLVDIWQHQPNYEDFANVDNAKQDQLFKEAQGNLAAYTGKTVFLRNFTSDAVKRINEMVDYIYVDARHDYCGVLEDIELYWPKLKSGGIMAGHDYLDAPQVQAISQQNWAKCMNGTVHQGAVKGAVDDFFKRIGLPVHVTYQDAPWSTWVVLKP
ncbi:hypothetical protein CHLRE_09g416700v5 [Chlamydomonas reinhardtii]|uniref:O-methyltransferase n=1 Tax=Chlamydomonas reinhardtii TaxID=3055 RepID=A0A2K3DG29_CHLRE|nr:uncharacterized protein CHLRE_09g416700v5 [Chlamydomonas reinhardtii]PNW79477.1 hypothetical protein CHLRE_09g416700v5 [Chlamydomonas reinhardtii]